MSAPARVVKKTVKKVVKAPVEIVKKVVPKLLSVGKKLVKAPIKVGKKLIKGAIKIGKKAVKGAAKFVKKGLLEPIGSVFDRGKPAAPAAAYAPSAPTPAAGVAESYDPKKAVAAEEEDKKRKRRRRRRERKYSPVLTSTIGDISIAPVAKKKLMGE
jgi:hypothetical protein